VLLRGLEDHLEKLDKVQKSTLCALEIEYLGYILRRDGIKPQSNTVPAILQFNHPKE
jgi:hypothetical protein